MSTGTQSSPVVTIRRQLGRTLRQLREDASVSPEDVSTAKIMGKVKLWRIEKGRIPVKPGDVFALCHKYKVGADVAETLASMAEGTSGDWWEVYSRRKTVPEWLGILAGLEGAASSVSAWHGELIPGLLQTREYATAVIAVNPELTPAVISERVNFRMERQKTILGRLDRDQKLTEVTVVVGTGALELVVGSPEIMRVQLEHLRIMDSEEGITVKYLPWTVGAHAGLGGPFTILGFDDPDDPSAVYFETHAGGKVADDEQELARFVDIFHEVERQALSIREYAP